MISTHGMRMNSAHYARMGTGECRRIHLATLEVLEQVGVDVHDSKALEILAGGGAKIDGIRARIPEYMVEDALRKAPRRLTLYDRLGDTAIRACDYNPNSVPNQAKFYESNRAPTDLGRAGQPKGGRHGAGLIDIGPR